MRSAITWLLVIMGIVAVIASVWHFCIYFREDDFSALTDELQILAILNGLTFLFLGLTDFVTAWILSELTVRIRDQTDLASSIRSRSTHQSLICRNCVNFGKPKCKTKEKDSNAPICPDYAGHTKSQKRKRYRVLKTMKINFRSRLSDKTLAVIGIMFIVTGTSLWGLAGYNILTREQMLSDANLNIEEKWRVEGSLRWWRDFGVTLAYPLAAVLLVGGLITIALSVPLVRGRSQRKEGDNS